MRVFLSLALLPLLYSPALSQALTGDEIKSLFFNGKPFVASSTTRQRFTMVFTPDGKATREQLKKVGEPDRKDRRHLESGEGRLLHLVEAGVARDLLSAGAELARRCKMVGDEGRGDGRELDQAAALMIAH